MQELVLSIIKHYIQDNEASVLFSARLFLCNKEKKLLGEIEGSLHHIIDVESRDLNEQFTSFTADLDRALNLFDNKVNDFTSEFISNTLNTLHNRG